MATKEDSKNSAPQQFNPALLRFAFLLKRLKICYRPKQSDTFRLARGNEIWVETGKGGDAVVFTGGQNEGIVGQQV